MLPFEEKICTPETFASRMALLPQPVVLTNGVFDILHRGHVTYLAQAREDGKPTLKLLTVKKSGD